MPKSTNSEEEGKKTGLWGRTKQVLKVGTAITTTAIAGVLCGPIGAAVAIGILAYGSHKLDERNTKKNPNQDNSESHDKKSTKENTRPKLWKRALFIVGSIALGFSIGGPVGIIAAAALVIADTVSKGKLTEWSENVLKTPVTLLKEGYSKMREAQPELSKGAVVEKAQEIVKGTGQEHNGPSIPGETGQQQSSSITSLNSGTQKQAPKEGAPLAKAAPSSEGVTEKANTGTKPVLGHFTGKKAEEDAQKDRAGSVGRGSISH
ncbi:hypothetical protein [Wolbachia endosymbiont of Folsomia candida]|uniref:hypothetical protein n=1 Tax=Wolbachia endosymbiont of Folsomia candida TaxID=169402 RepID=UPI000AEE58EB|nr:hypothetical protein [Wolbachia endosymbiont of Folsomia candida]APR98720.1 hypothetical protein ASM33_05765 [Wolbachia endosymbiont of Folsomia candida]